MSIELSNTVTSCQVCFKDLMTLTPENIQTITQELTSVYWVGLRKKINSTSNTTMFWSHWANGDPLTFQNWYPGWPVLRSSTCTNGTSFSRNATENVTATSGSPNTTDESVTENSIEDSCVVMLSFGAWVERNCSELLPFICYEGKTHLTPLCCCPLCRPSVRLRLSQHRCVKIQPQNRLWDYGTVI